MHLVTRFAWLYGLIAVMAGLALAGCSEQAPENRLEIYQGRPIDLPESTPIISSPQKAGSYSMGALEGFTAGGLAAYYLGEPGHISADRYISLPNQLYALWVRKAELNPTIKLEAIELGEAMLREYQTLRKERKLHQPTFKSFVALLTKISTEVTSVLDASREGERDKLAKIYRLSPGDVELLIDLLKRVDGMVLVAYSMTEIMPYDGEYAGLNIALYNFLLRNGGEEFITRLPSITSNSVVDLGPFQFTPYALSPGKGAALVNRIVPQELRIPEEVKYLVTLEDHSRAAIYFALHNLASAFHTLREVGAGESMRTVVELEGRNLAELLAAFHHRPLTALHALRYRRTGGIPAAIRNLSGIEGLENEPPQIIADVASYAEKTGANYDAVLNFVGTTH